MEAFVETVRMDMETRMESALSSVDPWATQLVSSHGVVGLIARKKNLISKILRISTEIY
jgi:hypothetical protein